VLEIGGRLADGLRDLISASARGKLLAETEVIGMDRLDDDAQGSKLDRALRESRARFHDS